MLLNRLYNNGTIMITWLLSIFFHKQIILFIFELRIFDNIKTRIRHGNTLLQCKRNITVGGFHFFKNSFSRDASGKIDKDFYETVQYHELHDSKFDQATLVSLNESQMLFARKGSKVFFVDYYGNENLEAVVDKIYNALNDFSVT